VFLVHWLCQNLRKADASENLPTLLASIRNTLTTLVPPWDHVRLRNYLGCICVHALKSIPWLRTHAQCTEWLLTPTRLNDGTVALLRALYCENPKDDATYHCATVAWWA
jgi:hypothetical protein